jgi:hypothetical protein
MNDNKEQNNELGLFQLKIDENDPELGVDFISTVDKPAIQTKWVYYQDEKEIPENEIQPIKYRANEEKQMVMSPILVPGRKVWRYANDGETKYETTFSESDIEQNVKRFFKNGFVSNINLMHTDKMIEGCYIVESWIIPADPKKDKSYQYGFRDLTPGTWMVVLYFEDKDTFETLVKSGEMKGLSIQGKFIHAPINKQAQDLMVNLNEQTQNKNMKTKNNVLVEKNDLFTDYINQFTMNVKSLFTSKDNKEGKESNKEIKFVDAKTSDNIIVRSDGEDFATGAQLNILNEDGTMTIAPDGDYTIEDGDILTVVNGLITKIQDADNMNTQTQNTEQKNTTPAPAGNVNQNETNISDKEMLKTIFDKLTILETRFTELNKTEIEKVEAEKNKKSIEQRIDELQKELEKIGKQPAGTAVKFQEPKQVDFSKMTTAEKFAYNALQHANAKA